MENEAQINCGSRKAFSAINSNELVSLFLKKMKFLFAFANILFFVLTATYNDDCRPNWFLEAFQSGIFSLSFILSYK